MKIKLLPLFAFALVLASCGDDDDKPKSTKYFTFDGEKKTILTATYDPGSLANGNYELTFSSDEFETDEISIELSGEHDGQTVDLTEVDNEFDWSWWVEYVKLQGEDWVEVFEGFGSDEESFNKVAGGTLYIKLVDDEEMIFDVKLTVITTEDKTFKLAYKGKFTTEGGVPARKSAGKNQ